ncbi:MAG: hypothetical protein IJ643_04475, partial [Eubacterium sp.]|nr:hypothetical protein [Eubacterium sp.]
MGLSECRKLKILVDCDNVLEDLLIPWVAALNEKYDRKIRVEDIKQWDLCNCYPGLSRTQVFSPLHTPELWASLEPLPSSQFYLKKLIEDGHRVVIVTSAHPDTIPYKWKFIEKN